MRPPKHEPQDYARDLVALTRMLRRVVTDETIAPKDKKVVQKNLNQTISVLMTMRRKKAA